MLQIVLLASCVQRPPHTEEDLRSISPDPTGAQGLCCWQSSGEPRQPRLRAIAPGDRPGSKETGCQPTERQVRWRQCQGTCCLTPGGVSLPIPQGQCEARGGWSSTGCPAGVAVCCRQGELFVLQFRDPCDGPCAPACDPGWETQDLLLCDLICCRQMGTARMLPAGICLGQGPQGGTWVDPRQCEAGDRDGGD